MPDSQTLFILASFLLGIVSGWAFVKGIDA